MNAANGTAFPDAKDHFQEGDIVWAKMPGYPYWPSILFFSIETLYSVGLPIPKIIPTEEKPVVCFLDSFLFAGIPRHHIKPFLSLSLETVIKSLNAKSKKKNKAALELGDERAKEILFRKESTSWTIQEYNSIAINPEGLKKATMNKPTIQETTKEIDSKNPVVSPKKVVKRKRAKKAVPQEATRRSLRRGAKNHVVPPNAEVYVSDDEVIPISKHALEKEKVILTVDSTPTSISSAITPKNDVNTTKRRRIDRKLNDPNPPPIMNHEQPSSPNEIQPTTTKSRENVGTVHPIDEEPSQCQNVPIIPSDSAPVVETVNLTTPNTTGAAQLNEHIHPMHSSGELEKKSIAEKSKNDHDKVGDDAAVQELIENPISIPGDEEWLALSPEEKNKFIEKLKRRRIREKESQLPHCETEEAHVERHKSMQNEIPTFDKWEETSTKKKNEKEAKKRSNDEKSFPQGKIDKPERNVRRKPRVDFDHWYKNHVEIESLTPAKEKSTPKTRQQSQLVDTHKMKADKEKLEISKQEVKKKTQSPEITPRNTRRKTQSIETKIPATETKHKKSSVKVSMPIENPDKDDTANCIHDVELTGKPLRSSRSRPVSLVTTQNTPKTKAHISDGPIRDKKHRTGEKKPRNINAKPLKEKTTVEITPSHAVEEIQSVDELEIIEVEIPEPKILPKRTRRLTKSPSVDSNHTAMPVEIKPSPVYNRKKTPTKYNGPIIQSPLSSIWESKTKLRNCQKNFVWDHSYFHDTNISSPSVLIPDIGDDMPVRGKRQVRSVQHNQMRQNLLNGDLDPHTMVECAQYDKGRCQLEAKKLIQPYHVRIHPDAVFLCDLHSHLALCEIIGFLGGKYDKDTNTLYIHAAFPCRSLIIDGDDGSTDVEMDPESEIELRELIEKSNMEVVGWYHSHPLFVPDPSLRDIENQSNYQQLFKRKELNLSCDPFVGLIVGTYDPKRTIPSGLFRFFCVHGEKAGTGQRSRLVYLPYELTVTTRQFNQRTIVVKKNEKKKKTFEEKFAAIYECEMTMGYRRSQMDDTMDDTAIDLSNELKSIDSSSDEAIDTVQSLQISNSRPNKMIHSMKSDGNDTTLSGTQHTESHDPSVSNGSTEEHAADIIRRRLQIHYGNGVIDCVDQILQLIDYYRTFNRRIKLNEIWHRKMTKLDKIRQSLLVYVKEIDVPVELQVEFVEDVVQYLDLSWS